MCALAVTENATGVEIISVAADSSICFWDPMHLSEPLRIVHLQHQSDAVDVMRGPASALASTAASSSSSSSSLMDADITLPPFFVSCASFGAAVAGEAQREIVFGSEYGYLCWSNLSSIGSKDDRKVN